VKKLIKNQWKNIIAVFLAAALLYLAFRNVLWAELWGIFQKGRSEFFILALLMQTCAYFTRSLRWRILLSADKPISVIKVFWGTMSGYLGNNLLPARAGEIIRTLALGNNTGLSKTFILGTILVERVVDVAFLVLVGLFSISSMIALPKWQLQAIKSIAILGLILLGGILLAPHIEKYLISIVRRLPSLSEKLKTKALILIHGFLAGLCALQHAGRLAGFVVLTLVVWLLDAVFIILIGSALHLSISISQAYLLLAALGLSSAIPSTPGYIGIYQFVAVKVLTPIGFSQSQALAFIISLQAISYCSVVLFGFIGLWQLGALHLYKPSKLET
jgi:uncharacterized protein (TIRG00374 family)